MENIDNKILHKAQRRFVLLCLLLVGVLLAAQFITLGILGTRGTEVSRIRSQQQELRLLNEQLRAQIDETRTLENVESGVEVFKLRNVNAKPIEITTDSLKATDSVGLLP